LKITFAEIAQTYRTGYSILHKKTVPLDGFF
jgi:hypothetical protein